MSNKAGTVAAVGIIGGLGYIILNMLSKEKSLNASISELKENIEQRSESYKDLSAWFTDASNKVNDLNQQIADMKNAVVTNPVVITVSDGVKSITTLEPAIEKSIESRETISKIIEDAGGMVSSGTKEAAKIIDELKNVVAYQVPGWMPEGEV